MTQQERNRQLHYLAQSIMLTPALSTPNSLDDIVEDARADRERRTLTDSDVWMRLESMTIYNVISDNARTVLLEAMTKL